MKRFLRVILLLLISLDRLVNALLLGSIQETLSSRAYRMRVKGQPIWGWTANFIDLLFSPLQRDHCHQSFLAEARWRANPASFWE